MRAVPGIQGGRKKKKRKEGQEGEPGWTGGEDIGGSQKEKGEKDKDEDKILT